MLPVGARAEKAKADNEFMGMIFLSAEKAKPCATLSAIRSPVKEPGPTAHAITSTSFIEHPAPSNKVCVKGRRYAACALAFSLFNILTSVGDSLNETEQASALASKARITLIARSQKAPL